MNRRKRLALWLLASMLCSLTGAQVMSNLSYRRFTPLDRLPQMQTETVWQDARGYIYIGTLSGFVRYDGRQMTPFLGGRRENIVGFQPVGDGVRAMGFVRQWDISGDDLSMVPIDPLGHMLLNNFNAADLPPGYVLLEDRDEQNRVLCRIDADGIHRVMEHPLFDEMTPDRKLYIDGSDLYIPTEKGVFRVAFSRSEHAAKPNDKANLASHSPLLAPRNALEGGVFSLIRSADKLYALAADGIYTVVGDSLRREVEHNFEAPDYGLMVRQNRQGQLIIADSHTIWRYDPSPIGGNKRGAITQLATGFNLIKSIFIDSWNRLWAATYQGVYCFFYCDFVNHRLADSNDIVRAVASCGDHLVMGTLNGNLLVDGQLTDSREGNFFAPCAAVVGRQVYLAGRDDIACVEEGRLRWLGWPEDKYEFVSTFEGKLVVGTRSSIFLYDPADSRIDTLATDFGRLWGAADDGQGRLWVCTNPGLYCITKGRTTKDLRIERVKETPQSQIISTMSADGRGHVVFAIGDSLFAINGGELTYLTETQPKLAGHEIRAVHLSPRGYLVVAAIDGLLVARYDGKPSDIHWFDHLNGFTMIEPLKATMAETADGTIYLCGLEEMTSFRPEQLLADNQQQTVIEPPLRWWQHWWVWLIAAALLTVVVWRIARWFHLRKARKRMALLQREKRQKELQLQGIRLKAIPHFHANVLASIEYFVMNNSPNEASHYLKLYSDFTNRTLSDIDRPARSVADEVDYVRTYLELEQLRYGERLKFNIRVAPDVDQKTLLPTMLLHTFTQNAVKHGIAVKQGQGKVCIDISRQQRRGIDGLLVAISDDGVGRTEAAHNSAGTTKQGLKILRQQIELYNQANRHSIEQQVSDLTDPAGQPAGTRFDIWIPHDYKY